MSEVFFRPPDSHVCEPPPARTGDDGAIWACSCGLWWECFYSYRFKPSYLWRHLPFWNRWKLKAWVRRSTDGGSDG